MEAPTLDDIRKGCEAFAAHEPRDAMYRTATFLLCHFWGKPREVADGLGVLLLTWNQAFYRYGSFDFGDLENCIQESFALLEGFRRRDISTYDMSDDLAVRTLFDKFLEALQVRHGRSGKPKRSPVAVAKALHLLAPAFFPVWDNAIARAYACDYSSGPAAAYTRFMGEIKPLVTALLSRDVPDRTGKTALKMIDEYNYSRFTKGWISQTPKGQSYA